MMTHNLNKIHRHQLAAVGARTGPHTATALPTTNAVTAAPTTLALAPNSRHP
jgi:hypothetical protein